MLEKFKKLSKPVQIIIASITMLIALGSTIVCLVVKKDHAEDMLWLVIVLASVAILFWVIGPTFLVEALAITNKKEN